MEPDIIINCNKKCNNKCNCFKIIIAILSVILAFALGIVLESAVNLVSALSLAYFIEVITILIIEILSIIIFAKCICKRV